MNVLKQDMPEQVWEPLLYSNSLSVHFMTEENLKTNHIKLQATKHKLHWQCGWIIWITKKKKANICDFWLINVFHDLAFTIMCFCH